MNRDPLTLKPDVMVTVWTSTGHMHFASFLGNESPFLGDSLAVEREELLLRSAWLRARDATDQRGAFAREYERLRALHPTPRR